MAPSVTIAAPPRTEELTDKVEDPISIPEETVIAKTMATGRPVRRIKGNLRTYCPVCQEERYMKQQYYAEGSRVFVPNGQEYIYPTVGMLRCAIPKCSGRVLVTYHEGGHFPRQDTETNQENS